MSFRSFQAFHTSTTAKLSLLLVTVPICFQLGCSRRHYRMQADREAYGIIAEKSYHPRWGLPSFTIEIDPRSRYFDPFDPDRPPMPPDDPASHVYMHRVDGMRGWPHWHRNGDRVDMENPVWRQRLVEYADINEEGEIELSVESALRVAYVHSPDYQQQVETLYLSALDVSTERFRLDTQFFGGNGTRYDHFGGLTTPRLISTIRDAMGPLPSQRNTITPAVRVAEQNRLTTATDFQLRRNFAAAGELLVGFANSFVWEFTGGDVDLTGSVLNFALVQPLLRGAGRDVALERLTIIERGLLANLRAFQRYREGFYTRVAIGDFGVAGPSRRGGFTGGTGLTGFSGTGAGGLGGVGEVTGFGRGGFGGAGGGAGGGGGAGFAGGGAGAVGGFIGLLQQSQQIRNTQDSLDLQRRTLTLLEAYLEAGVIDLTQVDQFRQNIETETAVLLQDTNALTNAIENYLTGTLGLPPTVPVDLDDQLILQFQLIDPRATALQNRIAALQNELGELPEQPPLSALEGVLKQAEGVLRDVGQHFENIRQDLEHLEDRSAARESSMSESQRRSFQRDKQQLRDSLDELQSEFEQAEPRLRNMIEELVPDSQQEVTGKMVVWFSDMYRLVQVVILVQARARLEAVYVEPIQLDMDDAFQVALANRLDLMNNRASLVDTWRLIQFNADALQSALDVEFSGDIQTARNNPLSFRAPTGTLRAGLRFDAPFTRLLERNNYRQALIDYQRDRRQYIRIEDTTNLTVRQLLRRLEELRLNLEIQRRAVAISIRRVDLTREELNRPVPPPEPGQPAPTFGPTAALNLLTALSDLRNTQNNFMSVWLNHYAARMQLMRELGIMVLDENGNWIDQPIPSTEPEDLPPMPPPVPTEWLYLIEADSPSDPSRPPAQAVSYQGPIAPTVAPRAARRP